MDRCFWAKAPGRVAVRFSSPITTSAAISRAVITLRPPRSRTLRIMAEGLGTPDRSSTNRTSSPRTPSGGANSVSGSTSSSSGPMCAFALKANTLASPVSGRNWTMEARSQGILSRSRERVLWASARTDSARRMALSMECSTSRRSVSDRRSSSRRTRSVTSWAIAIRRPRPASR